MGNDGFGTDAGHPVGHRRPVRQSRDVFPLLQLYGADAGGLFPDVPRRGFGDRLVVAEIAPATPPPRAAPNASFWHPRSRLSASAWTPLPPGVSDADAAYRKAAPIESSGVSLS